MDRFYSFLQSMPWYAWVAIVAIVCGAITKWIAMNQQHHERMSLIQQGYDPGKGGKPGCGV